MKAEDTTEHKTEGNMKEITYFYLARCPYYHQADRLIAELIKENPQFAGNGFPHYRHRMALVLPLTII